MCDRAQHVEVARTSYPNARVLALTPEAAWACEKHDIQYVTLDDATSDAALNDLGEATTKAQYKWAAFVDQTLRSLVPEFSQSGFAPAQAHLYWLKIVTDAVILPAQCIRDFRKKFRPHTIVVFERSEFKPRFAVLEAERPLHPQLATLLLSDTQFVIESDVHDVIERPAVRKWSADRIWSWVRGRLARLVASLTVRNGRRGIAWLGDTGYAIGDVVDELRKQGYALLLPPRNLERRAGLVAERERMHARLADTDVLAHAEIWAPSDAVAPELRDILRPFYEHWLLDIVPLAWTQFLAAREWLADKSIVGTFGVEAQDPQTAVIYNAAGSLGLPRSAFIHNGGLFQDLPIHDLHGPVQCDTYLVNGRGDADYFESLNARYDVFPRASIVPVGSPRLENLAAAPSARADAIRNDLRKTDTRPLILYVPTLFCGCYRYFGQGHISDVRYWEMQQQVLRSFREFDDVRLLYKPFHSEYAQNPVPDFLKTFVPNAEIVGGRLTDLMWAVDGIIVDFSATAITEIVCTNKPLIIYAGREWARMAPEAIEMLSNRAAIAQAPSEFQEAVAAMLQNRSFEPVPDSAETFRRMYMTHDGSERAAARAARVIATTLSDN